MKEMEHVIHAIGSSAGETEGDEVGSVSVPFAGFSDSIRLVLEPPL